ncbi:MAG: hypothetical protein ACOYYS_20755 [Chloroflexota bacterium]
MNVSALHPDTLKTQTELLQALKAQIELMRAKTERARPETKLDYSKWLADLYQKQIEAEAHLENIHTVDDERWEQRLDALNRSLAELQTAVTRAVSRFE